jgi:hypothetical protein
MLFCASLTELLVDIPDESFRASSWAEGSRPHLARLVSLDLFARSGFSDDNPAGDTPGLPVDRATAEALD